jgi:uncharacterized membrane protein
MVEVWQLIAAAGTVAAVWFAARQDTRAARTELQMSIEKAIAPRLDAFAPKLDTLNHKIDIIREENAHIRNRLNSIEEHLRRSVSS